MAFRGALCSLCDQMQGGGQCRTGRTLLMPSGFSDPLTRSVPLSPLGHNMATPPPTSPPLSRQEEGKGQREGDDASTGSPSLKVLSEGQPTTSASHWSDCFTYPTHRPPQLQGAQGMSTLWLPAKAGSWGGKELAFHESVSFVPHSGTPFSEQLVAEYLLCAQCSGSQVLG